MCGILGFNWGDEKLSKKLGNLIKHRGPDGEGHYSDDSITLGHRRLSIIDLSEKGRQPMPNEDGNVWITFNGEIFNFEEIREELESKGHKFNSKTDTEVIVHGYEEWGHKVLERLDGQFAFCIYDKKKKEFFLARDRLGINPLYYCSNEGKFVFGSELKVLMGSGIKKEIDVNSFNHYVMYGYTPRKETIFRNVFKVEPAHFLVYDLTESRIKEYKRYWNVDFNYRIKNEDEAKKRILSGIEKSIKSRMIADVPVGAFLSGGVDSSAVVAFMSKYTKNLNTFSVKFDRDEFDESRFASIVSKKFGTKHHVIEFSSKDVKELFPKLVYHYDEPFGDPSMVPTFLVSKVAREYVTVSLSGDGGDELFGGYNVYGYYNVLKMQKYYPKMLNKIGHMSVGKAIGGKAKAYFEIGTVKKEFRYASLLSYLSIEDFKLITGKDASEVYKRYTVYNNTDYLATAMKNDLHNYLPSDILTKVDRASLANSLESRPPLLDHRFVELSYSIDNSLKRKKGEGKYILKKALEGILPKEILYRKKQGFGFPLRHYLDKELKDYVVKYVLEYNKHNLFRKEFVSKLKRNIEKGSKKDYSRIIWSIMMFNMWWDEWME